MPDVYPSDLTTRIRDLEKAVEELRALAGVRQPITEMSAGLILPHRSAPPPPTANGVHIYGNAGRLWVTSSLGSVSVRDKTGVAVANPPNFQSGTATGTDAAVINQLRADAAGTKVAVDNLLSSLRSPGIILT